ncbi:hypothetical protein Vretimale_17414, partial [Volvox reticuliferus]
MSVQIAGTMLMIVGSVTVTFAQKLQLSAEIRSGGDGGMDGDGDGNIGGGGSGIGGEGGNFGDGRGLGGVGLGGGDLGGGDGGGDNLTGGGLRGDGGFLGGEEGAEADSDPTASKRTTERGSIRQHAGRFQSETIMVRKE